MTDLQDRLGRLAPTVDPETGLAGLHRRIRDTRRWRRIAAGVVASVALVGAVASAVVVLDAGEESGTRVVTEPAPGRPDIVEGWEDVGAGPVPAGFQLAGPPVWTGDEFLWWGTIGGDRWVGAAFDPETTQWRRLAAPDLNARRGASIVWTGSEMVLWGGADAGLGFDLSGDEYQSAAAAYDPEIDRWRAIADAPMPPRQDAAAVWTGSRVIVVGGDRFEDLDCLGGLRCRAGLQNRLDGAAYDPVADAWTAIQPSPEPVSAEATWTGQEVLAFSPRGDAVGYAYDPELDRWSALSDRTAEGGTLDLLFEAAGGIGFTIEEWGLTGVRGEWFVYDRGDDVSRGQGGARPPAATGCAPSAAVVGDVIAVLGCGQAVYDPVTASWYDLEPLSRDDAPELHDLTAVTAVVGGDDVLMVLGPSVATGPRLSPDFVLYRGDFATYTVPDVEGLTLGEARRIMAAEGFVLNAHEPDPQGDDAVVRAQEPPGGTPALGIAPEVGVRTDPAP